MGAPGFVLQRFAEKILPAHHQIHQPDQAVRSMVGSVHMNVDPAGAVGQGATFDQLPDDVLQVFDVLILQDRADHFAAEIGGSPAFGPVNDPAIPANLRLDGDVTLALPLPAFGVLRGVGVVSIVFMANAVGSEVGGDDLRGGGAGDAGQLDFDSEVLILDGGHCGLLLDFHGIQCLSTG